MIDVRLEGFQEYQPLMDPRPGISEVVAEMVTRDTVDGSVQLRHRAGRLERIDSDNAILDPGEGPRIIASLKDYRRASGRLVVSTQVYELKAEGQQLSLI